MTNIEQLEVEALRAQLTADLKSLVEEYRAIFDWDVPDVDEVLSDQLILQALRQALDGVEATSSAGTTG